MTPGVMLTANLAVQDRMANGTVLVNECAEMNCILPCVIYNYCNVVCSTGTQGRLLQWQPDRDVADKRDQKALLASHPDLQARFLRESALRKESLLADIDFLDVTIRSEIMPSVQGAPAMMQLPLIPSYALTVHGESQHIPTERASMHLCNSGGWR